MVTFREFVAKSVAVSALVVTMAGCGQMDGAKQLPGQSVTSAVTPQGLPPPRRWPIPPPHHPWPHPFPTPTSWSCEITGKDGDVFGNFTGTGSTQAAAEANGLSACQAIRDYASCWVDSCTST